MEEVDWLISDRGTQVPFIDGYKFISNGKERNGKSYWRCSNNKCQVTATMVDKKLKYIRHEHNHPNSLCDKIRGEFRARLKIIIKDNPFLTAKKIYDRCVIYFSEMYVIGSEELNFLPTYGFCKTVIYDEKRKYYQGKTKNLVQNISEDNFESNGQNFSFINMDENLDYRFMIGIDVECPNEIFSNSQKNLSLMDNNTNNEVFNQWL